MHLAEGVRIVVNEETDDAGPGPASPYLIMVAKAKKPQLCKVWPCQFDRPLPTIPVPLAKPDAPIEVSVQPMIDAIYRTGRYARSIDYRKTLTPALDAEQEAWLRARLP